MVPKQSKPSTSSDSPAKKPVDNNDINNDNEGRDPSSKLEGILSTNLLEIGEDSATTSWTSSTSKQQQTQQPKVAVGPIMSNWTAFSGGGESVELPYSSFTNTKSDPPSVQGATGPTTPTSEWNMDFALPHGLLSSAADSEDDLAAGSTGEKRGNDRDSPSKQQHKGVNNGSGRRFKQRGRGGGGHRRGGFRDRNPEKGASNSRTNFRDRRAKPRGPYDRTKKPTGESSKKE